MLLEPVTQPPQDREEDHARERLVDGSRVDPLGRGDSSLGIGQLGSGVRTPGDDSAARDVARYRGRRDGSVNVLGDAHGPAAFVRSANHALLVAGGFLLAAFAATWCLPRHARRDGVAV